MLKYINAFKPPKLDHFLGVFYGEYLIGFIHSDRIQILNSFSNLFQCSSERIEFTKSFQTLSLDKRIAILAQFSVDLRSIDSTIIWRDELYGIYLNNQFNNPIFAIERGVVPLLGLKAYGTHLNSYIIRDNQYFCWIAKRSKTKAVEPLKLDQMVAGGLSYLNSPTDNLRREALEEANIPLEITQHATMSHQITYQVIENKQVRHDSLISFDLQLPNDFDPHNQDGEVESFHLLSHNELIAQLDHPDWCFKPNSALIFIDFLLRHGLLNDHPNFQAIKKGISEMLTPF